MPFYETDSEARWWVGIGGRVLLVVALIGLVSFGFLFVRPMFMNQENKSRRSTYEYQETKRGAVLGYIADVRGLEAQEAASRAAGDPTTADALAGQRRAVIARACEQALLVRQDSLPPDARDFVSLNCH